MKQATTLITIAICGVILLGAIVEMPPLGNIENPTHTRVVTRYLERGYEETGSTNIVTGVLVNYRGYDTLGEVVVIFTALCAVIAVLSRGPIRPMDVLQADREVTQGSVIVKTVVRVFSPFLIMFALYLVAKGHVAPGGGFQGGAVAGAFLILFTLVHGLHQTTITLPLERRLPLEAAGVFAFVTAGLIGLAAGFNFLTFTFAGISPGLQYEIHHWVTLYIELGIAVGGGIIFVSIFSAMQGEKWT